MNPLELLFRSGNQTIFLPQILVKIGALEFIVPVDISINRRKKLIVTEIFGADFDVKEDFGCKDYAIEVSGKIGNTDSSVGAKICGVSKKVEALEFLSRLSKLYEEQAPFEISDVSEEFARNFLGKTVRSIGQAFDLPFGGPSEPEGILNKLGINRVVLHNLDIRPVGAGHYQFHIECYSELDEPNIFETDQVNVFLTENETIP